MFSVEPWTPDYAAPFDADGAEPGTQPVAEVDERVEAEPSAWEPRGSAATPAHTVMFTDGVQRIDAWVWVTADDGTTRPGICASYAAGVVCCDGRAEIPDIEVRRGLFSAAPVSPLAARRVVYRPYGATGETTDQLRHAVQQRMGELEADVARRCAPADLIVIDGPLRGRQNVPGAVGFIKTHQTQYLSEVPQTVVAKLAAGERTPLFLMTTSWTRYSWYLRLPGPAGAHPWSSIVRCEASADLSAGEAGTVADLVAATLPKFASAAHKDPRAPQNLYPIGGLERRLKHRLGDPALLYRDLCLAARSSSGTPVLGA